MNHGSLRLCMFACVMLFTVAVTAQPYPSYTFSQAMRPYEALGANKKMVHSGWQYSFNRTIPLSFSFRFWGNDRDDQGANVNEKGEVWLRGLFRDLYVSAAGSSLKGSAALEEGFVNCLVEGPIGKRIAKVEYEHVGFQAESPGKGYISFQIWFYEENHMIEMHYGPRDFSRSPSYLVKPASVGLYMNPVHASEASVHLSGDPASPTIGTGFPGSGPSLDEFPKENTVYRFTPEESTQINKVNAGSAEVVAWYAPEQRSIEIRSLGEATILHQDLYTMDGRKVALGPVQTFGNATTWLDVSGCSAGLYLLRIQTKKGTIAKKIDIY